MEDNYYITLLKTGQKFFNTSDLQVLWNFVERTKVNNIIRYYKTKKKIYTIKSGLFSLIPLEDVTFEDKLIIAQKIITPSYVSYHTALNINGVNFQYYESIHLIADYYKKLNILGTEIVFHKITDSIFLSRLGLKEIKTKNGNYTIAGTERSIIDTWYLNPNIGLDINYSSKIDKKLLIQISNLYNKPSIKINLKKYFKI
jgi:predicted transcriptional regulator of viral defense system